MGTLSGKKVAILVTDGFEQVELTGPRQALDEAGVETVLVAPKAGEVKGMNHHAPGDTFKVDLVLGQANAADYDAIVLPGGVANPDALRGMPEVQRFVRAFYEAGKPIAAICHGPWTLIDAGIAKGKRLTSWPSLKTDLTNAGARWVDEEVVVDDGVVTSRKPDDIPAFNRETMKAIASGLPPRRSASANGSEVRPR